MRLHNDELTRALDGTEMRGGIHYEYDLLLGFSEEDVPWVFVNVGRTRGTNTKTAMTHKETTPTKVCRVGTYCISHPKKDRGQSAIVYALLPVPKMNSAHNVSRPTNTEHFIGYFVHKQRILLLLLFYQQAKHLSFVLNLENGDSNRCSHRRGHTISRAKLHKNISQQKYPNGFLI